jgi:hypothetical protein
VVNVAVVVPPDPTVVVGITVVVSVGIGDGSAEWASTEIMSSSAVAVSFTTALKIQSAPEAMISGVGIIFRFTECPRGWIASSLSGVGSDIAHLPFFVIPRSLELDYQLLANRMFIIRV